MLFGVWRTINTAYLEFELGRGTDLVSLLVVVKIGSIVLADLFDDIVKTGCLFSQRWWREVDDLALDCRHLFVSECASFPAHGLLRCLDMSLSESHEVWLARLFCRGFVARELVFAYEG